MVDEVLKVLKEEYPDIDFMSSDSLVQDGIINSLTLVGIISALSMEFGIEITFQDINEENFKSVRAIAALVERLSSSQS